VGRLRFCRLADDTGVTTHPTMKTTIILSTPAELEAESLVAVVLDHSNAAPNDKDKKPELKVATADSAVQSVASDLLASGESHVVVSTQDFPTLVAMSRRSSIESHQATVKKARDALGRHPRPELSTAYVEPQSDTEVAIAGVWTEALGLEQVGVHDNFFELGGNSLIGMEIIAQVRTKLGLSYLPPHILYQAPTVSALAQAALAGEPSTEDAQEKQAAEARELHRSRIEQRRSTLRSGRV